MGKGVKTSLRIPEGLNEGINEMVQQGYYTVRSQVIIAALHMLEAKHKVGPYKEKEE